MTEISFLGEVSS